MNRLRSGVVRTSRVLRVELGEEKEQEMFDDENSRVGTDENRRTEEVEVEAKVEVAEVVVPSGGGSTGVSGGGEGSGKACQPPEEHRRRRGRGSCPPNGTTAR
ncbi:uncharacterized protein LOC143183365 [Calliopsis andreniformis]|uniref:uncharacterized protein LOC143183365 n=1 Tax=Calliopsis andreniformis TaxID=337506 RepID=UPI003FCDF119